MNQKIINIQFLRAFAALLVIFYHTSQHYFAIGGEHSGNFFSFMSQIGYAGVDIFFVISGYIMWYTTHHTKGLKKVLAFIYARLTRIYPLYWSFLFLQILLYWGKDKLLDLDLIGSFFLTTSSLGDMLLPVAWTLQYELYFYCFFALLLFIPRQHQIKMIFITLLFIISIQFYAIIILHIYDKEHFYDVSPFYTFWVSPFLVEFLLGSFVAYFFEHYRIKYLTPIIIAILTLTIGALYYQDYRIEGTLEQGYFMPQRVLFFGTLSMFLIALMVELNKRKMHILPKVALYLGNASYSLYLSHTVLLYLLYKTGTRNTIEDIGVYQGLFMLIIIGIIVGYSLLHYKYIELPLLKLSKKIKNRLFYN